MSKSLLKHSALTVVIIAALPSSQARGYYSYSEVALFSSGLSGATGNIPHAGLTLAPNGDFYGSAYSGGPAGVGTIYRFAPGTNTITRVAYFSGLTGYNPNGGVILDASGNIYGTTQRGGTNGVGTIYKIAAGTSTVTTLASFTTATNGSTPLTALTLDASGNLYGTASTGGANGYGTVFKLAAGSSNLTTLVNFNNANGASPFGGLTLDPDGNLFGSTNAGGASGYGTIFKLSTADNSFSTLFSFDKTNGSAPYGALTLDSNGNLFGKTSAGGAHFAGTVFKLAKDSDSLITLGTFDFLHALDPNSDLTMDVNGDLYAVKDESPGGNGKIYRISTATDTPVMQDLTSVFNYPISGLTQDSGGNFYGTTATGGGFGQGSIYKLITVGGGSWLNTTGASNNWSDSNNWSNSDVPQATNSVFLSSTSAYAVNVDVEATASSFSQSAGNVTLNLGSRTLQLSKNLIIGGGTLTTTGAVVTGTASVGQVGVNGTINLTGGTLQAPSLNLSTAPGALKWTAGTLNLGTGSITGLSTLIIPASGILSGNGTINANLIVNGKLAPGNSPGQLTVNGTLDFNNGSTLAVDVSGLAAGTEYDQTIVNGVVELAGASLMIDLGSFVPSLGQSFMLIDNDGVDPVTGRFTNTTDTGLGYDRITVGTTDFNLDYTGGSGNDVVLTVVPEPTCISLIAAGSIGLLRRRRRGNG